MSTEVDKTRRSIIQLGSIFGLTILMSKVVRADELTDLVDESQENHIVAVRVWPSSVYTRLTLEADASIHAKTTTTADKLIVDITNSHLNNILQKIHQKVLAEDPIIRDIKVEQFNPDTIRITVYLKQKIKAQTQTILPVNLGSVSYKYRYVLDMYPLPEQDNGELNDELLALLQLNSGGDEQKLPKKAVASTPSIITSPKTKNGASSKKILVMIDPGHGGEDPGAIGAQGTKEKDIVLDVGKKLYDIIGQTDYMCAGLTRSEDIFIPLGTRVAIARKARADIFVSIHADAFTTPAAKGASVFVLSDKGASSTFAKWLAKTQNDADAIGGMSYKSQDRLTNSVLLDMTQTWSLQKSNKLGQILLSRLAKIGQLHNGHIERAAFAVLKAPDIPSVLVETAFISNPEEESLLIKPEFRQTMALTIFGGLSNFSKIS